MKRLIKRLEKKGYKVSLLLNGTNKIAVTTITGKKYFFKTIKEASLFF